MPRTTLMLALAAAATIAAPAYAAASQDDSVAVRYKDLDLSTQEGQKALEQRLDRAARTVCGSQERTTGTRIAALEARACYRDAKDQLSRQVARVVGTSRKGG